MRGLISVCVLLPITIGCGGGIALAGTIIFSFTPSTQSASVGRAITAGVRISGLGAFSAPSMGTFDLNVGFDPNVLKFDAFTFGDPVLGDQLDLFGLGSITSVTPSSGTVNLFELSLDSVSDLNSLQAANFLLGTLTFDTIRTGESPLVLTVNALGDADGNSLSASATNGSVNVVPEPKTVWLLMTAFALYASLTRRRSAFSKTARPLCKGSSK
jgi:hypothetical protein